MRAPEGIRARCTSFARVVDDLSGRSGAAAIPLEESPPTQVPVAPSAGGAAKDRKPISGLI